ncbi:hypothetical protein PTKU46_92020 [Paraburkholderia terrae]
MPQRAERIAIQIEGKEHAALQRQCGDLGNTQLRRQKEPHVIYNRFNETNSVCHVIDYAILDALVSEF